MSPRINNIRTLGEVRLAEGPQYRGAGANDDSLVPVVTILASPVDIDGTLRELVLRIEGLLESRRGPHPRAAGSGSLTLSELTVDQDAHRVTVGGAEVALTGLEFKLLVALMGHGDRVYPRGRLLGDVWASHALNRTRKVDTHVKRLRDKLGPAGRLIQTVRGIGYRFGEAPSARPAEEGEKRGHAEFAAPRVPILRRA